MTIENQSLFECILYAFEPQLSDSQLMIKRGIKSLKKLVSHYIMKDPSILQNERPDPLPLEDYLTKIENETYPGGKVDLLVFSTYYKAGIWLIRSTKESMQTEYISRGKYEKMIFIKYDGVKPIPKYELMVANHSNTKDPKQDIRFFSTADSYVRNKIFNIIQESRLELENFFTISNPE